MSQVLNKKYKLLEKIGQGTFGTVYKAVQLKTNETVAIKTESAKSTYKLLKNETTILKYLYDHGCRTTPIVYWYGVDSLQSYLVMSFYEISLYDYMHSQTTPISQEKIDKIMQVTIDILQTVHKHWILHRDIKPHNFMISQEEIYLIDFGFASFYVDEKSEHLPCLASQHIIGTPKYASFFIHEGHSASRRDDLISLGYMYLYLICRELPWLRNATLRDATLSDTSLSHATLGNNYSEIHIDHPKNVDRRERKSWKNLEPICLRTNEKITEFLKYCYNLSHNETPNYDALIQLFT
jgi:serine/threonine protein kinase